MARLLLLATISMISVIGGVFSCIPMHTDDFETTPAPTTPSVTTADPTTTTVDPCAGCVPPPVRNYNILGGCEPDEAGTVTVSMKADGDKCILEPKGCSVGYLFVFEDSMCGFTTTPTAPANVQCMDGNFYATNANSAPRQLTYFVGGCSTFTWD